MFHWVLGHSAMSKHNSEKTEKKIKRNLTGGNMEDIYSLFEGKDSYDGGMVGVKKAYDHLMISGDPEAIEKIGYICLVFLTKPTKFLMTGLTRSGLGDGKPMREELAAYLPKLTSDDETALKKRPKDYDKYVKARREFPAGFKLMNITCIRLIAFLWLELDYNGDNPMKKFFLAKYGRPSRWDETNLFFAEIGGPYKDEIIDNRFSAVNKVRMFLNAMKDSKGK